MGWRGEPECEFSGLHPDECAHCTGAATRWDQSLKEEADVDDPMLWVDDE